MITKEMTKEDRELAITYLKEMQETYIEGDGYERHPLPEYYAIETALEALKQENCEDCVSREKAITIGEKLFMLPLETEEDVEDAFEYFKRQIKDLPPVIPTGYKMEPVEQETCEDAISRQAVADFLENHAKDFEDVRVRMSFSAASSLVKNADNVPSVTPTQKKGHWKWEEDWTSSTPMSPAECNYAGWMCSECGEFPDEYTDWDNPDEKPTYEYCPNCGSEMKED